MKEVIRRTFVASDGEEFTEESYCAEHELNLLYKQSGVRLYTGQGLFQKRIPWLYDALYNDMTEITIDRSKEKENQELKDFIHEWYGWSLIEEAIDGTEEHYEIKTDKIVPKE